MTLLRMAVCAALVGFFVWSLAFFYFPGLGFTYLVQFGENEHARFLPELKATPHYELVHSGGYDAQYYAQIAMHPKLTDPVLARAVDGLIYRARRILCPAVAWAFAGADPVRALHLFSVENFAAWALLALILLRWMPPDSWQNVARWCAVLLSFGVVFSVVRALPDLPALLLVAAGMALAECGRPWWGAFFIGIGGLAKDVTVLAVGGLPAPQRKDASSRFAWLARAAVVALPVVAWMLALRWMLGGGDDIGMRNFSKPFCGLALKLEQSISQWVAEGPGSVARLDMLVMVGLVTQMLFFFLRRRPGDPWWRLGAAYALLMVFLGDAVWENYPTAAARVLLPMTLAFNVSVPRARSWLPLLLLGNLGVLASFDLLKPPGRESCVIEGPASLRMNASNGESFNVQFPGGNWWRAERSRWEYWRWSLGDTQVTLHNPQPYAVVVRITFNLRSYDARKATVKTAQKVLLEASLPANQVIPVGIEGLVLPPGDTQLLFLSDRPGALRGNGDPRKLSFSVRDMEVDLLSAAKKEALP